MVTERIHERESSVSFFQERFRKLMSLFRRSSTTDGQAGGQAAATAVTAQEPLGPEFKIEVGSGREKTLIQVHPCPEAISVVRKHPTRLYCLDIDESEDPHSCADWVRRTRQAEPFENRRIPVIYVIGPGKRWTRAELYSASEEIGKAGAHFIRRSDYRQTFLEAMQALAKQLQRQYRQREGAKQPRHTEEHSDLLTAHS